MDWLLERNQFLAAGQLVLSAPELFQDTAQCIKAVGVLYQYAEEVATRFGGDRDELAITLWLETTRRQHRKAHGPNRVRRGRTSSWRLELGGRRNHK